MSVERFIYCPECGWEGAGYIEDCPVCDAELRTGGTVIY